MEQAGLGKTRAIAWRWTTLSLMRRGESKGEGGGRKEEGGRRRRLRGGVSLSQLKGPRFGDFAYNRGCVRNFSSFGRIGTWFHVGFQATPNEAALRFYARRATRGDCADRHSSGAHAAGAPGLARIGSEGAVQEQ